MESKFIYFNEEAKFRIVSSICILAIILLVILSSLEKDRSIGFADLEYGKVRHYSKILGIESSDGSWDTNGYLTYRHKINISIKGNTVFAASSE